MSYTPTVWVEKVTKLGPTNLNKMEQGIYGASNTATGDLIFQADTTASASGDIVFKTAGVEQLRLANGGGVVIRFTDAGGLTMGRSDAGTVTPDFLFDHNWKIKTKGLLLGDVGDSPDLGMRRAGPDGAAYNATPAALGSGVAICGMYWQAYGGSLDAGGLGWNPDTAGHGQLKAAQIYARTTEAQTATGRGVSLIAQVTPNGTIVSEDRLLLYGSSRIVEVNLAQMRVTRSSLTDSAFATYAGGGDNPLMVRANGKQEWGNGTTAADVFLERNGVGSLLLTGKLSLTANLNLSDNGASDIQIGTTTGSKIGQPLSKLAFYGSTPIVKPTLPSSGSVTAADVRLALINLGLCG